MEMLRTLVRDKAQAIGPQSSVAHPDQRREDPAYPQGFTPPYTQTQPMPQMGGFPYGYLPQTNEVGQNSGANMANPIAVSDLDDPKEQEKIRKESLEQFESNEA